MPAGTIPLTVVQRSGTAAKDRDLNLQNSTVSPGNNFVNTGKTMLLARNTQVGAANLLFEGHVLGTEITLATCSVPGSATDSGIRLFGPFETDKFNSHAGADVDRCYVRQSGGANGDLQLCPFEI